MKIKADVFSAIASRIDSEPVPLEQKNDCQSIQEITDYLTNRLRKEVGGEITIKKQMNKELVRINAYSSSSDYFLFSLVQVFK